MDFTGVLEHARAGGGGCLVRVPADVAAALGGGRSRVKGTLDGVPYRSNLMPSGGGSVCLGVHKATREAAGRDVGDEVSVTIERDDEPREVAVPPELQAAFDGDPDAKKAWDALAPSHRREHANAVAEAKKPETRARRVEKALEMLRART